jgi:uncharacterized protein
MTDRENSLPDQEIKLNSQGDFSASNYTPGVGGLLISDRPVFFENKTYEFEFHLRPGTSDFEIHHIQRKVEVAFRSTKRAKRGSINFGNEIGWFKLELQFIKENIKKYESLSIKVFPTKLDMTNDLAKIHSTIDAAYPLWRFAFAKKTIQELAISRKSHENFPLLWLSQFESLREQFSKNIRIVCLAPHNKLTISNKFRRVDNLKGKLTPRIEQKVAQYRASNLSNKYFETKVGRLSVDTLENRFVKMTLENMSKQLGKIFSLSKALNNSPENDLISESFFIKLKNWQEDLRVQLLHPLFKEVGSFDGGILISQVLFNKVGYSGVYRGWQDLKAYLDLFGRNASISHRSVNELYEVWCFLEIKRILQDLGFRDISPAKKYHANNSTSLLSADGNFSSFKFERTDGVIVRLAHEPVFRKPTTQKSGIYSWSAVQKPDIVLQANFPDGEKLHWIFDAKYRVEDGSENEKLDFAPEDAINQMHRYRDALIQVQANAKGKASLSRPFVGAYVLFPGWYPDNLQEASSMSPYSDSIAAVGIGGFPVLPGQKNVWLTEFLKSKLSLDLENQKSSNYSLDRQLADRSVRIPPSGLELRRSGELVLVATTGMNRSQKYISGYQDGSALWYHTRDKTVLKANISDSIINDITHVLILIPEDSNKVVANFLFSVISAELKPRSSISHEQSGTLKAAEDGNYWLFSLGHPVKLNQPLRLSSEKNFRFGFCSLSELDYLKNWDDISSRYSFLKPS